MAEIRWTEQALADIEWIPSYILRDSEKYASIQVNRFFERTEILETFPLAGRIVPELKKKFVRELITGNYRIVYRVVSNSRIDIIAVHHSARLIKNILRRRL